MQWSNSSAFFDAARQPPYLEHHGIRGQKWGVRNYQNEDGSLTAAGKKRYEAASKEKSGSKKKKGKKRDWKASDAENLTDEELRARNNRLQAEQNYKNNTTSQWKKDARNWRNEAIKKVLIGTATTILAGIAIKNYKKVGSVLEHAASRKVATIKAAGMLKKSVNSTRFFDGRGPEILGKHIGRR